MTIENGIYIYKLHQFPPDKYCVLNYNSTPGICQNIAKSHYPGEFCDKNTDCMYGICQSNICEVTNPSHCNTDEECNYGKYCNSKSECETVAKFNEKCEGKKCDSGLVCNNNVCIIMGTIENGKIVTKNSACKSFYAYKNNKDELECIEGPKLRNKDRDTGESPNCTYGRSGKEILFELYRACGYTEIGTKYCNPGLGDVNFDDVFFII